MTPQFLSLSQASQLRKVAKRFRTKAKPGKPWKKWTDEGLWLKVLGQIAVVGKAEPGERLQHDPKIGRQISIKRLSKTHSDIALQKYLHKVFVSLGVRYVGRDWRTDKKAAAGVKNFRILTEAGGPKEFFRKIAKLEAEPDRIEALQKSLKFYGDKGARDTLIELRLAENCMALDARIYGVLEGVGVKVSPDDIFRYVENELIQKVAKPLGVSGGQLDRIFFKNYDTILKTLKR
jgi:hypothetical protein